MEFYLSSELEAEKQKYEAQIAELSAEYARINDEITKIREGQGDDNVQQRQIAILEKQIELDEKALEIEVKKQAISKLYVSQMLQELDEKRKSGEISATEYSGEKKKIDSYREMSMVAESIDDYYARNEMLEKKLRVLHLKSSFRMMTVSLANVQIQATNADIKDNNEHIREEEKELSNKMIEFYSSNLYFLRNTGKLSTEELQEALADIESLRGKTVSTEEIQGIYESLVSQHLRAKSAEQDRGEASDGSGKHEDEEKADDLGQYGDEEAADGSGQHEDEEIIDDPEFESYYEENEEYERVLSARDYGSASSISEKADAQNMDETHKYQIYRNVSDLNNKIFNYINEALMKGENEVSYVGKKLGEDYSKWLGGEEAELAKQFAFLSIKNDQGEFQNPDDVFDENQKLLLQLEKVDGINVQDFEETIGLDTSVLHQQLYVATYEIDDLGTKQKKPVKEYFRQNEDGELVRIGTATEQTAKFMIDGAELSVDTSKIKHGEQVAKITQRALADKVMRETIEKSMNLGTVTQVAELTDNFFLQELCAQCLLDKRTWLSGSVFLVSSRNQVGEEDFDIVLRDNRTGEYTHLDGMNETEKSGRTIYTTTGEYLSGGEEVINEAKTLKEYVTPSGHRYAITRNSKGKLGINEIYRETRETTNAKHIDTYALSLDDLVLAYNDLGIRDEDLQRAYQEINRAKEERENTSEKAKAGEEK